MAIQGMQEIISIPACIKFRTKARGENKKIQMDQLLNFSLAVVNACAHAY